MAGEGSDAPKAGASNGIIIWLLAVFLGLVGAALAIGGVILAAEGGSLYYLLAGLLVLGSAVGLIRRAPWAAYAYAALLLVTIAWSLWEAGLDGWALMPRLVGPALIGLLFLLPSVRRAAGVNRWWVGGPALAGLLLVGIVMTSEQMAESGLPSAAPVPAMPGRATDWSHWGNDVGGTRYASLDQIDTGNVGKLELAWRYDSDLKDSAMASLQAVPLAADGRLYICLEMGIIQALDQETGKPIWRYRALPEDSPLRGWRCRGVGYHRSQQATGPDCQRRIFLSTPDGVLTALDADTGRRCSGFGKAGLVDLKAGMGPLDPEAAVPTSPPTVVNGVVVLGQAISDYGSFDSPSGVIRGYDAVTGALRWAWDAGRPGQALLKPGEIYTRDTPNAWGVFSGDEKLGLVFVGTGNSPPDYWAGKRSKISDSVSASMVAIDVATGAQRWIFNTVHHDLWDYDIASQPVAVDLPGGVPALIVSTKRGELFVLDRRTGKSIDKIVEKPVPQGAIDGGYTAPTQPYTTGFPSVAGDDLREADMWGLTPLDQLWCRLKFRRLVYAGQFTPILQKPTILYPGAGGAINWGSVSVDTQRHLLIVNSRHFANIMKLTPEPEAERKSGYANGVIKFAQSRTPYSAEQILFMSPLVVPCQKPPYGKISAFDIRTRKLVWSKPFGTAEGSGPFGVASHIPLRMGVPHMGGSVPTAGGLTFIAASQDRYLRAYDTANGRELWRVKLPAIGGSTPISYISPKSGRQFVVTAAGGHFSLKGPKASAIVAYALPKP